MHNMRRVKVLEVMSCDCVSVNSANFVNVGLCFR